MSYKLVHRALLTKAPSNSAKLVMWALADHVNEESQLNTCYPSLSTIAEETGLSLAQVPVAIKQLEEAGFLTVYRGGGRTANTYLVTLPQPSSEQTAAYQSLDSNREYNKESNLELIAEPLDAEEESIVKVLRGIKGYRYNRDTDVPFVRELIAKYPSTDIEEVARSLAATYLDTPLKPKDHPRAALRNWCRGAADKGWNQKGDPDVPPGRASGAPVRDEADEYLDRQVAASDPVPTWFMNKPETNEGSIS